MRSGMLAKKVGMSRFFDERGRHVSITLLSVEDCVVVSQRTLEKNGYVAVQVGIGGVALPKMSKPLRGVFEKNKALQEGRRRLAEFRVDADQLLEPGCALKANHFELGAYVDVTATSKGKGFQGVMKRHNFGGLRASHGVSVSHRSHGSTGQRSFPGRVFKNKKMAGHLGHERVTIQSMCVVFVDADKGWIGVRGGVPGPRGEYVMIRDAVKKSAARKEGNG
jgi:large subunit ribosomal protein L3